ISERIADPEIALVRLAHDEVRCGWLADDDIGDSEMAREIPHLRLEQVAERVDWRRIVGVPGEVAEQALRLVARAQWNAAVFRREVEQRDHAHARHDVAAPAAFGIRLVAEIAIDGRADIDGA